MQPQRETFQLRAAEILYLTALTGGSGFPGLELNFEEHSEAKIRTLMDAQMKSLEMKGYLEVDFMGEAQVNETIHKWIEAGASCVNYIYLYTQASQEMHKIYYFFDENQWFEMICYPGEDRYEMQELYSWYEWISQILFRVPLKNVGSNNSDLAEVMKEIEEVEDALANGASILSLAEVKLRGTEGAVERELVMLLEPNSIWELQFKDSNQIHWSELTFAAAMERLTSWLQTTGFMREGTEDEYSVDHGSF